ncbi:MAG: hypothetical protein EBY22_12265 [Gammaproteobacteria bacterium]|nr:hypothetical protein [Gammaproteobacteria bacterium]
MYGQERAIFQRSHDRKKADMPRYLLRHPLQNNLVLCLVKNLRQNPYQINKLFFIYSLILVF